MRQLIVAVVLSGFMVAACSRSPEQALVEADQVLSHRLMGNLVEKDASHQTNALIRNLGTTHGWLKAGADVNC
jgi:uncharacterized protein YcfL